MGWFRNLFAGRKTHRGAKSPSLSGKSASIDARASGQPSLRRKNVALAVVMNPTNAVIIDAVGHGSSAGSGMSAGMVRDFIVKDLKRYPDLCAAADAIEEIFISTDESISPSSYAQDMTRCYLKHMRAGGWAAPEGLHIFETFVGPVTVYVAYGI